MRNTRTITIPSILLLALCACRAPDAAEEAGSIPRPPVAKVVPERLETHGDVRVDDYHWLRQREDPEVIAYLEAENAYTRALMAPTEGLQEELYQEMVGRVRQDDSTVPWALGDYLYYTRYEEGKQYPLHCRRKGSMDAPEEVLLDVEAMAPGQGYFSVGRWEVSPGGGLLAYGVDTRGRRFYTIEIKDLERGRVLERIPDVTSNIVWAEDDRTLFYARQDPETLRSYQIWRHRVGTDPARDVLVYQEDDETFGCRISKTRSREYLLIGSSQTLTTEYRALEADDPIGEFRVIEPRERGHEYHVDHHGEHFYLRTNLDASNSRLVRAPVDRPGREHWEEVLPHRGDVLLQGIELFRDHLVVRERRDGLVRLRIRPFSGEGEHEIDFSEPAYSARPRSNREFDTAVLRIGYSSLTTPDSVYDYDMRTRERKLRKRQEVRGGFDPLHYRAERLWAPAPDGTRVPISLVGRRRAEPGGPRPVLLYGYGSYGASMDARFRPNVLSLLDRGFCFAIAHVRGGQEMGRHWYEDGKLLRKLNTFTDFIACGEHLVEQGYARPDGLYAMGGSAGGLLVGAAVNMAPELFAGVIAEVPFVDVVTTMLDASIPLTTSEWDEWGDPRDPTYYHYMLSYSPYDQVEAQAYPHLLVTAGLHDSQVQYWEPAKWVARLRATKTDDHRLLFKCDMEAGHGGVSGRYRQYRDQAFQYAFLLDLEAEAGR